MSHRILHVGMSAHFFLFSISASNVNLLWGTLRRVLYCITYYVLIAVSCRIRRSLSTLQRRVHVSHYGPANPESLVSLHYLYGALDNDGAAENMTYGGGPESAVNSDGSRVVQRKKCFRGPNGLFFTLFVCAPRRLSRWRQRFS